MTSQAPIHARVMLMAATSAKNKRFEHTVRFAVEKCKLETTAPFADVASGRERSTSPALFVSSKEMLHVSDASNEWRARHAQNRRRNESNRLKSGAQKIVIGKNRKTSNESAEPKRNTIEKTQHDSTHKNTSRIFVLFVFHIARRQRHFLRVKFF